MFIYSKVDGPGHPLILQIFFLDQVRPSISSIVFANTYYFPILIHYRLGKITSPIFSLEESKNVLSNFLVV